MANRFQVQLGPLSYWQFDVAAVCSLAAVAWLWRRGRSSGPLAWVRGRQFVTQAGRRLQMQQVLGQGGMSTVFAAASAEGPLAVKLFTRPERFADPDLRERFLREVQVCTTIQHPRLVRVVDWGQAYAPGHRDTFPFLVMERLSGRTLRDHLSSGPVPLQQALQWTDELLDALAAVHHAGVIDRDVKPENVMILPTGHVKLMDFSVARVVDREGLTKTGALIGTPIYMSPEHFDAKRVQPQSDIYCVGVLLYELLSGAVPYDARDVWRLAGRILTGDAIPLERVSPGLPAPVYALVGRMMQVAPADRYASAEAARAAVQSLVT